MNRTRVLFLVLVATGLAVGAFVWWQQGQPRPADGPTGADVRVPGAGGPGGFGRRGGGPPGREGPTPVMVTPVAAADVPVIVDGIGTVQAYAQVTVRAQVEGRLVEIAFREGEEIAAGTVLARIDPASFKAVYDQAVARREQDEAELRNARIDLERYVRLAQSESGSRQQADTQRAVVAKLEAQIKIDQGVIDAARVNLDNTTIRAPIAGRTGIRAVDVGALVRSSDTAGIVSIAQIHPITVTFTLPQQQLAALLAAQARGDVPVEVIGGEKREVLDRGRVEVIDNQVDTTTGTVKVKATLPNSQTRLWPGQFVDVRVMLDMLRQVTVVPTPAVQRGPEGAVVWVIEADDKALRRSVEVVRQDEKQAVIGKGLAVGETVITTGFTRLTDGSKVKPTAGDEAPGADRAPGAGGGAGGRP